MQADSDRQIGLKLISMKIIDFQLIKFRAVHKFAHIVEFEYAVKRILEYLLGKVGFDTAKNEPAQKLANNCTPCCKMLLIILLHEFW